MNLRVEQGRNLIVVPLLSEPVILRRFRRIWQAVSVWCWAACMEMILIGNKHGVPQCKLAAGEFKLDCCVANTPTGCQRTVQPHRLVPLWLKRDYQQVTERCSTLSLDEVRNEIDAGRPVEVWLGELESCEPLTGSGHLIVVTGYYPDDPEEWVVLMDPNPNNEKIEVSLKALRNG